MLCTIYFQTLSADLNAFFEHFHDHGRLVRHSPPRIYHFGDSKIPGIEGKDYPSYSHIPETGFTCSEYRQKDKMYADRRTRCQVRKCSFMRQLGCEVLTITPSVM
jgi:hypothetical protein